MIQSVNPIGVETTKKVSSFKGAKTVLPNYQNQTSVMDKNAANALKALNSVSFKGSSDLTPLEKSFIKRIEIRIPNILDIDKEVHIPADKMPKDQRDINVAGVNLKVSETPSKKLYTITNDLDDTIFIGEFDKNMENKPVLTYKQGKYMPEITIKDKSLGKGRIKMFAGSQVKGEGFNLVMPGEFRANPSKNKENISFTGNVYITTLNKENNTRNAVERYFDANLENQAIIGDYADTVRENEPTFVIPAGGFGERFYNIPRDKENKPSAKLPTTDDYRVMGTALDLVASTGSLGKSEDDILYLSQAGEIYGDNVKYTRRYKTDGGAIAEGLTRSIIDDDKDMIILNADIFTNADITHAYKALKTLPNAALVIPYYPVNPQRAKSFGLMAVTKDEQGNLIVDKFIEKPHYTTPPRGDEFRGADHGDFAKATEEYLEVKKAKLPDENMFMANPGLYFISKEGAKVLTAMGILETSPETNEKGEITNSNTGLGKNVMPKIVELANNGMLLDEEGNPLKVYTLPLEARGKNRPAVWDDIGTAAAYLSLIKDVANETYLHGTGEENKYYGVSKFVLEDFEMNTDRETGIVFSSPDARDALESFKEKYNVEVTKGNIFVTTD